MKHFLILLSSITTLTISSNTFANFNQNTTFTNSLQTNKNNVNQISLFNNQYGYLSTSDWITNQSTADHKFYSYDTSALKNYTFANARKTFLVDITGNLVYNPDVTIPDKDKTNIENTKQEMISHKKINTIKDDYNPYSKSEYSTSYFADDNQNWQYIQQGGIEKHIDISQQAGGDKVEHSDSLSETLGLYYIAKATRQAGGIDQKIADSLASYFIKQSSLKDKLNKILIDNMINLIINDDDIYNFIYHTPFSNTDKNYSLNCIFDNNNNLVKVYYNEFDKSNINNNLNYHYYYWTYLMFGTINDSSDTHNLLNWKKYAHDWNTFIKIFPTFVFDKASYVNLSVMSHGSSKFTNLKTNDILTNQGEDNTNSLYNISVPYSAGRYHFKEIFDLNIWHDNENIYFKWFLCGIEGGSEYTINLNNINFINIMN